MSAGEKEVVEDKVVPSFLGMSDEELMNAPPPVFSAAADPAPVEEEVAVDAADKEDEPAKKDAGDTDDGDPEGGVKPTEPAPADVAELAKEDKPKVAVKADDLAVDAADKDKLKPKAEVTDKEAEVKKPEAPAQAIDFEAEYKRLLTPFKANGKDIAVESVDDAIALMQMGANYNKKMAGLKPNLKLMKMLENNGFLSEEKIGFLIDLGKKDPAAINKLVKDSGIDPMDLDAEKASAYKQTAYAVDDREMELDTVLDELQGTPTYTRTLDVVSNKWDVASKQVVSQTPQLLKVINDHVASGIYDLISKEVAREQVFGRLKGLSDIEAYRQVGDAIQARGGFSHLAPSQVATKPAAVVAPVIVAPKPKVEDDKLKDKRRAASSTPSAASGATAKDFDPLSMSDEEFSKVADPKFLKSK